MKKLLFLLPIMLVAITSNAQKKMYVWPPDVKNYIATNTLKNVSVNLEIKDFRVITPDSEIKATFDQISDAIKTAIIMTYGKEFINPESDIVVIIELRTCDVQYYSGMWHAQTKYIVKMHDLTKELEQTNNTFNVFGRSGAKKLLTKCFTGANMRLFDYFNSELSKYNNCNESNVNQGI